MSNINSHPEGDGAAQAQKTPAPALADYDLLEEIGRGGMGVVYRARDRRLNREVAVKLVQDRYAADSSRFVAESQITGQLQHPGIPAVHELGTLSDGRPFLAMKLVKGQTLAQLLDERDKPSADGKPGQGLGRFIAIFEQICQAVGYEEKWKKNGVASYSQSPEK